MNVVRRKLVAFFIVSLVPHIKLTGAINDLHVLAASSTCGRPGFSIPFRLTGYQPCLMIHQVVFDDLSITT